MTAPSKYTYQWKRNGTVITGATGSTYVLQAADAGDTITCTVTATNSAGSATSTATETSSISTVSTNPMGIAMGYDPAVFDAADSGLSVYKSMVAAGFGTVRLDLAPVVGSPATLYNVMDLTIRAAVGAGLDVLLILDGYHPGGNVSTSDFLTFVTKAVSTYAPLGVHHYEVINEPNYAANWDNTNWWVNPSAYATLLHSAYSAIHTADSQAVVLHGGLSVFGGSDGVSTGSGNYGAPSGTTGSSNPGSLLPGTWMTQFYAATAGTSSGYFDVMAVHPYSYPANPTTQNNWGMMLNPSGTLGYDNRVSVRGVMVTNGDSTKRIWSTEFGCPTSSATNANIQAQYKAAWALWETYSYVGRFYWFNYNDDSDGTYGLVDSSYNPKPQLATVQSFM